MDPREYELMYQVEDHHWWYQGMASITRAVLDHWAHFSTPRILDAGCGTGAAMTSYLAEYGKVTGVDLHPHAVEFCRKRNITRISRASILNLPFASASFELVTSFDVLYERAVIDEEKALKEFSRVLTQGGKLLLRLPAYNWLRGQHDDRVHTKRRYTKQLVKTLLEQSGFIVEHLSYANTLLFPIAVAKRLSERFFVSQEAQSDLSLQSGALNAVFQKILASEAPLVAKNSLPYGLSIFAVGKK